MTIWKSTNLWLVTFLMLLITLMHPATQEWRCTLRSSALTRMVQIGKEHYPRALVSPWLLTSCLISIEDQKNEMCSWRNSIAYPPKHPTHWYNMIPFSLELRYIRIIRIISIIRITKPPIFHYTQRNFLVVIAHTRNSDWMYQNTGKSNWTY